MDENNPYTPLVERYMAGVAKRQSSDNASFQTSDEVADCIVDVILSNEPPLRVRTSAWAEKFCELKTQSDPSGNILADEVYRCFLSE